MNIFEELGRVSAEHSIRKLQLKRLEALCDERARTTGFIPSLTPRQYELLRQLRVEVKRLNSKRISLISKCRKELKMKDVDMRDERCHQEHLSPALTAAASE